MRVAAFLLAAVNAACAVQSESELFQRAVAALSAGNYAAAETGFVEVLKTSPENAATLENLGLIYARRGELSKAIATYRRALAVSSENQSVMLNLGLAYLKQESYADALQVFQDLMKAGATNLPAHDVGLLYPLVAGYIRHNDAEDARRKLSAFLSTVPPAQASLVLCKLYYDRERFDEAAAQCRNTLRIDPHFVGAHLEFAKVLASQHSPEASIELTAAIKENPSDPEALYNLGLTLLDQDRVEEAEKYLERARKAEPGFWGSYFNLGKVKLKLGRDAEAIPLLSRAAELNPSSFSIYYELGRALMAAGRTEEGRLAMQRVRELVATGMEQDEKALGNGKTRK